MEGKQLVFDFIKEEKKPKKKFLKIILEIKNENKAYWLFDEESRTPEELGIKIVNKSNILTYDE